MINNPGPPLVLALPTGSPTKLTPLPLSALGIGTVGPSTCLFVDAAATVPGVRGNAAFPFATVTAALAAMQAGDQIRIAPGLFVEAATLTPPAAVTHGSMVGAGKGITIIEAPPGIDVVTLGGEMDGFTFADLDLAPKAGGLSIAADAPIAPAPGAGAFMVALGLHFRSCGLISPACRRCGIVTFTDCTDDDAGVTWQFDTVAQPSITNTTIAGALVQAFDDDDIDKPINAMVPLAVRGASRIGISCTLGPGQGSIAVDEGAHVELLEGDSLTEATTGVVSSIVMRGSYQTINFGSVGALLPDTAVNMILDFGGSFGFAGGSLSIGAVGSPPANVQQPSFRGAVIAALAIGEGMEALAGRAIIDNPLVNITVTGNGSIIPPPFAMAPVLIIAAPQTIFLPWPFVGGIPYQVSVEYDQVATTSFCVFNKTAAAFVVQPQFFMPNTNVTCLITPRF